MKPDDPDSTPTVLAEVERGIGAACRDCETPVCGHEVMMSFVLGFKGVPRCVNCLVRGLDRELDDFAQEVRERMHHRDCWRAGWRRANELEGFDADGVPSCVFGGEAKMTSPRRPKEAFAAPLDTQLRDDARFDAEWDAGDLGCGDLVLELRQRLNAMAGDSVMKLTARDPGAPQDLPAWCGLTGHALLSAAHPTYFIQRRKE